jgi:hypothetical protein
MSIKLFILLFTLISFDGIGLQARSVRICKGTPLQSQFLFEKKKYIINDTIDLKGSVLKIPNDATLFFTRKGELTNGTIEGCNTIIKGMPSFEGVHLNGSFQTNIFYTSWCSSQSMSDYIEDVMNIGGETTVVVDCDITLGDKKRFVDHLNLKSKNATITNSDRYYITRGGCELENLKFRWNKVPEKEPKDNYRSVVIYSDICAKDTTLVISLNKVDADGGGYCSVFMRQGISGQESQLTTINIIQGCQFSHFTMGGIWTCGGTGSVINTHFVNIGYDQTNIKKGVTALRLGQSNLTDRQRALGYVVEKCLFQNIIAPYNDVNDGRGLHGLLVYGDSVQVRNNQFKFLSTCFCELKDAGMDSEILYFKGSGNIIEDNYFEDGAGSTSDAVLTLKSADSEDNVVRNNRFLTTVTNCKFVYVAGKSVEIEGNEFRNTNTVSGEAIAYAIYLGHRNENSVNEEAIISNNTFSFHSMSNYMAIYANRWGSLYVEKNIINNSQRFLKCNNREGELIVKNNVINVNRLRANTSNAFIEISSGGAIPARISDNEFWMKNVVIGKLVKGSNYVFDNNKINLQNVNMHSFLSGSDTNIKAVNNTIEIDKKSTITKRVLVGEKSSSKIVIKNNSITGVALTTVL